MTVADLIAKLQLMPKDAVVTTYDECGDPCDTSEVRCRPKYVYGVPNHTRIFCDTPIKGRTSDGLIETVEIF